MVLSKILRMTARSAIGLCFDGSLLSPLFFQIKMVRYVFQSEGAIPVISAERKMGNSHWAINVEMGLRRLLVMPSGPGALLIGVLLMASSIWSMLMLNSGGVLLILMVLSGMGVGSGC